MRTHRLGDQDGFVREILWITLVLAVVAVVLLDGISLLNASRSARDDAMQAAREARTEYAQSLSVAEAKRAADSYLRSADVRLTAFAADPHNDGTADFTVTVRSHADTYAFLYLRHVPGLEDWVKRMSDPSSTQSTH
jgi:Flp pilus assembly protein TadG